MSKSLRNIRQTPPLTDLKGEFKRGEARLRKLFLLPLILNRGGAGGAELREGYWPEVKGVKL